MPRLDHLSFQSMARPKDPPFRLISWYVTPGIFNSGAASSDSGRAAEVWTLELDFWACSKCSVVERRSMMLVMWYLEVRVSRSDWEALSYARGN